MIQRFIFIVPFAIVWTLLCTFFVIITLHAHSFRPLVRQREKLYFTSLQKFQDILYLAHVKCIPVEIYRDMHSFVSCDLGIRLDRIVSASKVFYTYFDYQLCVRIAHLCALSVCIYGKYVLVQDEVMGQKDNNMYYLNWEMPPYTLVYSGVFVHTFWCKFFLKSTINIRLI